MALPVLFVPVAAWIADKFTTKAWRFAAASFWLAALVGTIGALVGMVSLVSVAMPAAVNSALSILMPVDWAAQVAIVVACHSTVIAWSIFKQTFDIATK